MACCFPERFHEEGRAFEISWSLVKPLQMRSNRSKRWLLAIVAWASKVMVEDLHVRCRSESAQGWLVRLLTVQRRKAYPTLPRDDRYQLLVRAALKVQKVGQPQFRLANAKFAHVVCSWDATRAGPTVRCARSFSRRF